MITGASGTLGGPLSARAAQAGLDVTAAYFSRPERIRAGTPIYLDLREADAVQAVMEQVRPDVVIHAAVTERSGTGYDSAIRLSARTVAQAAAETGTRLIALSTDLVFDGTLPVYREDSPPQPMANSLYGLAKADAERTIRALYPHALIVRTSLIYDFDPQNAQVGWMIAALERGETLRLFGDQIRCPIWVWNLADALLELAEGDHAGFLNVVGPEPMSRYALGTALLRGLGIEGQVIETAAPDTAPKSLVLSVDRARAILKIPLLTIEEAMLFAQS